MLCSIVSIRKDETTARSSQLTTTEAGFRLYSLIAKPNELGLSPQVYEIYETVIKPILDNDDGLSRREIIEAYRQTYGRPLARKKLEEDILPSLESAGLIVQEPDPNDRRKMLVYPRDPGNISCQKLCQVSLRRLLALRNNMSSSVRI